MLVRAKYNFFRIEGGGVAAGVDLRLPTGDSKNLLGTGATQTRLLFIASGGFGRFAPHANIGYTFSSGKLDPVVTDLTEPSGLQGPFYTTVLEGRDAVQHRLERAGRGQLHVRHRDSRAPDA